MTTTLSLPLQPRLTLLAAFLLVLLSLVAVGPRDARAQATADRLLNAAKQAADIEFPTTTSTLSMFSSPRMALYKPDGPGPFPALVLQHQCGGLGNARWQNLSMLDWVKESVARGYVTLLVDSLGPRNVDTVCMGPRGGINFMRGVRDALQAAEHLRSFEFVDRKRIGFAGFSWGAMNGVLASSRHWAEALAPGERFAAAVSMYPGCFTIRPSGGQPFEIMNTDIDRPLLVLMGEEDTETPPSDCLPKLEALRAAGAPVQWHLYAKTTHCWDCQNLSGFSKVDVRGNRVLYRYDAEVTADAKQRMFDFLARQMPKTP